jgi:hypothetical protein
MPSSRDSFRRNRVAPVDPSRIPSRQISNQIIDQCAPGEHAGVILCNCNKNGAALAVRVAPSSCCVDLLTPPPRGADYFFTVAAVVAAADTHASEGEVKMLSLA